MSDIVNSAHRSTRLRRDDDRLQSPLLLAIRLYWGWQFVQDGWGKLTHLDKVDGVLSPASTFPLRT